MPVLRSICSWKQRRPLPGLRDLVEWDQRPSGQQEPQVLSDEDDRDADRGRQQQGAGTASRRYCRGLPQIRPPQEPSPQKAPEFHGDSVLVTHRISDRLRLLLRSRAAIPWGGGLIDCSEAGGEGMQEGAKSQVVRVCPLQRSLRIRTSFYT